MTKSTAATDTDQPRRLELTDKQERLIRQAACEYVAAAILGRTAQLPDASLGGTSVPGLQGCFVTLKRRGQLRACCGTLGKPVTLLESIAQAARRTGTEDHRLPPISPTELRFLDLGVTLLFRFRPISASAEQRAAAIDIGRHGLQIQRGADRGLLLPSVATENEWDAESFLRNVCRKANLPTTAWLDDATRVLTFEGHIISGPFDVGVLDDEEIQPQPVLTAHEFQRLVEHLRGNMTALVAGGAPSYYLTGCPDGMVHGLALLVRGSGQDEAIRTGSLSWRPAMPLQSTLFKLTENAARTVRSRGLDGGFLNGAEYSVTVLTDPAMHGTVADPDLRGIEPGRRAIAVRENTKMVWGFQPETSSRELLECVCREAGITSPDAARVFSLEVQSNQPSLIFSHIPKARVGTSIRQPAVAGVFYPDETDKLARLVDQLAAPAAKPPESWPAVMVPHAGLRYSGHVAAQVFQRVQLPETIIIIGPKHTPHGVEWAVAPHETWSLPGAQIASDIQLAKQLAAAIPGLELDAAAHEREHCIEVELPLIARFAPDSHVVGITLGAGNLERCRGFAEGLSRVLGKLPSQPLLVISSDMNHFATDEENRRLDEMALSALDRFDPAGLLQTVTEHNISMCGVLPAVTVLETLRLLGAAERAERVAYSTSADVSGDKSRVVGYAGMLFA